MDPLHTLDDIVRYGQAKYHGYYENSLHYSIAVYGPGDSPSGSPITPYDLPTFYIIPVSLDRHEVLHPKMDAASLAVDLTVALQDKTLRVIRGGRQASQYTSAIEY